MKSSDRKERRQFERLLTFIFLVSFVGVFVTAFGQLALLQIEKPYSMKRVCDEAWKETLLPNDISCHYAPMNAGPSYVLTIVDKLQYMFGGFCLLTFVGLFVPHYLKRRHTSTMGSRIDLSSVQGVMARWEEERLL